MGKLFSALVLALDIVVIYQVMESSRTTLSKFLWIVAVLAFPIGGAICWFVLANKAR